MTIPRRTLTAAAGALALAVVLPLGAQAAPAPAAPATDAPAPAPAAAGSGSPSAAVGQQGPTARPVNTRATDDVLFRESFDSLERHLQPRAEDPDIEDGTVGFTHRAPQGWSTQNHESMAGVGVEDWRGWTFTTRDYWVDAEDQMRHRFARSQGVMAVVDSDEFADRNPGDHTFASTLESAPVRVQGQDAVELSFDSHYRGWAGQSATVSVSFDGGAPQEILRNDSSTVTDGYDGATINANETHTVEVPAGARNAVFSWDFASEANSWYWAIDSVSVRAALPEATGPVTSGWVVSDIQGHPQDLEHGLQDLKAVRPDASGLLMVGDIVGHGTEGQWDEIHGVMDRQAGILPDTVAAAIGNHESYTDEGWDVLSGRFLDFAQRDRVWGEYVLEGEGVDLPVLVLGQEEARPPEVPMSEEQISWLERRLDHWTARDRQVLVISHFPLGDTHSASWIPWYHEHYEFNDRLTGILGDHPNAVMLNGHTHYPAELGDWAVQRRTEGGHPDGFWAVNTLAMHVEWDARGENTEGISEVVTRDINRGLTVDAYGDRLVVTARDFGTVAEAGADNTVNEEIRSVTIPNPLAE